MNTLGIPITLDRPRTLLIDEAAFHLIARMTGVDLAQAMRDDPNEFVFTLEITQGLILAGCAGEDARLTLEKVKRYVTQENYKAFHEPICKAIMRGIGISYQP